MMNPLSKVSGACRKLLTSQHISLDGPGTIQKDVQAMLEMIGTRGLRSKSRNGNLPMEVLPELNRRMCDPITLALGRPTMKDYPNLAGVYVLLRVIELLRADRGSVRVDEAVLARWLQLNPTEQYFSLLEAWLLEADDFGDSWRFSLRLESIEPPDASLHEPKLLTLSGTPPQQYPTYDEELEY